MAQIHTHYDNLKVTRNAPPEVIRAAYKSLSQKFHPDRNPGNPNATHTFQMIGQAYEVLSDPLKRRDHDNWIAAAEAAAPDQTSASNASARQAHFSQTAAGSAIWSAQATRWGSRTWQPQFDVHRWRRRLWRVQGYVSTTRARMNVQHLARFFFCLAVAILIVVALFVDP